MGMKTDVSGMSITFSPVVGNQGSPALTVVVVVVLVMVVLVIIIIAAVVVGSSAVKARRSYYGNNSRPKGSSAIKARQQSRPVSNQGAFSALIIAPIEGGGVYCFDRFSHLRLV